MKRALLINVALLLSLGLTSVCSSAQGNIISLESQVKGNQEQPNVLSIVPWKPADDQSRIDVGLDAEIGRLFQHLDAEEFARQQVFHKHFQEVNN